MYTLIVNGKTYRPISTLKERVSEQVYDELKEDGFERIAASMITDIFMIYTFTWDMIPTITYNPDTKEISVKGSRVWDLLFTNKYWPGVNLAFSSYFP